MRPRRRYMHTFECERAEKPIILPGIGETPCLAKKQAFEILEAYLQQKPELPPNNPPFGWRLVSQRDDGLAE